MLAGGCIEEQFIEPEVYGSVSGKVLSETTKEPIAGAIVRVSPSSRVVETNAEGFFRVDSLVTGNYTLMTTFDKYRSDLTTVTIEHNRNFDVSIYLTLDTRLNAPPAVPIVVKPAQDENDVEVSDVILAWKSTDADKDTLSYDVILFKEGETSGQTIASGISQDSLQLGKLSYGTTYYWQVIVKDGSNEPVASETWTFRTKPFPDLPYYFSRKVNDAYQLFASDGEETVQITDGANHWRPIVNPQRNRLAFLSNQDRETHIYVSDLDGRNRVKVTTIPVNSIAPFTEISFCWSPDGTSLVYPNHDKLYAIHPDGTGQKLIAQAPIGRFYAGVDWTEQENKIVVRTTTTSVYQNEISIIYPDLGITSVIIGNIQGKTGNPVFSVDGKKILYTYDVDNFQNNQGRQLNSHIFQYDLTSNTTTDMSVNKPNGTNDLDARYSPTGGEIIFVNAPNDNSASGNVYKYNQLGLRELILSEAQMFYWK